jgi:hypothetical protein
LVRARRHLLFTREPDIGKQSVIEPREGVELPPPGSSRCGLLAGAAAETDHRFPQKSLYSGRSVSQGQHSKISVLNPYTLNW